MFKKIFKTSFLISVSILVISLLGCAQKETTDNGSSNSSSSAEDFPEKEVEMLVPFEAGGSIDLTARALTEGFENETGQSLVVQNKAGGGGIPTTNEFVKEEADGYKLALLTSGILNFKPLVQDVNFNFPKDFTPILQIGDLQVVVFAKKDAPYDDVKEMGEYFKNQEENLRFANTGANTPSSMMMSAISDEMQIDFNALPFDGGNEVVNAVLGDNADIGFANLADVTPMLKDGDLKVLGVTGEERYDDLEDTPTLKEQGVNINSGTTFSIYAPSDLPEDVANKLTESFSKAIDSDEFKKFRDNSNLLITKKKPDEIIEQLEQGKDFYQKQLEKREENN